jgi:hypothetical protein
VDAARIAVDGSPVGVGASELDVPAGTHVITVTAPGFQTAREEVSLVAGSTMRVRVRLVPGGPGGGGVLASGWFWGAITGAVVVGGGVAAGAWLLSPADQPLQPGLGLIMTGSTGL